MDEARESPWAEVLDAVACGVRGDDRSSRARAGAAALASTAEFFWPDLGGTVPCGVYLLMVSAHHYQNEHLPEILRA